MPTTIIETKSGTYSGVVSHAERVLADKLSTFFSSKGKREIDVTFLGNTIIAKLKVAPIPFPTAPKTRSRGNDFATPNVPVTKIAGIISGELAKGEKIFIEKERFDGTFKQKIGGMFFLVQHEISTFFVADRPNANNIGNTRGQNDHNTFVMSAK